MTRHLRFPTRARLAAAVLGLLTLAPSYRLYGATELRPAATSLSREILAGDRLRIEVLEDPELSNVYPVSGDGTVDFGYIGRIQIAGLTVETAADRIEAFLEEEYFQSATVVINVAQFVEGDVLILGAIGSPGRIPFAGDRILTLVEAISINGGLTREADGTEVRILRWDAAGGMKRNTIVVDVQTMFDTLDFSKDQYLRPRDMVVVPRLGEKDAASEFLALGAVGSPGFYPYSPGLNLIRAVTRIGGLGSDAALESCSILRPDGQGGYKAIRVDFSRLLGAADMSQNIEVFAGDIIYAPPAGQATRGRVYLLGEVSQPGAVALPSDRDATLAKTLLRAGGLTKFANDRKIKILRTAPDGTEQPLIVDVGLILKTGAFQEDVPLRDGDVIIVPDKLFNL